MDNRIVIAHGGGGILTRQLIDELIIPALGDASAATAEMPDAAPIPGNKDLMLTTDSFVVSPLFFPGGDIGSLCVYGTLNDLAVCGAEPIAISLSLIIEEGLELEELERVLQSISTAAKKGGVQVITGDTKVVPRGQADKLYITTTGVGKKVVEVSPKMISDGDCIIINGPIAEHGITVMGARENAAFSADIQSDADSVWPMVKILIENNVTIHAMRDPTRGGLAACCVELADASATSIELDEAAIPVAPLVAAACDMLGLDPLSVANEGKLVTFVPEAQSAKALEVLKNSASGKDSTVIGKVVTQREKSVYLHTSFGGERIVEMPYGENLPRIC